MSELPLTSEKHPYAYCLLILLTLGVGVFIRVYQFPAIPPGFSQDEAIGAYDSFSLATTGQDRWGNKFPAYFPSWGSGQNVLLAYLSVPFIKALGLTVFSTRLPALLLGIFTLPLFFFCLRPFGRFTAFLGLLLLVFVPWHFMLSRWASEANIVPFFMLLGCTLLTRALSTNKAQWIIPSLLPFALSLYAYGTTVLVLPILFSAVFLLHHTSICSKIWHWTFAFALFFIVAFPFLLFFIENYILGYNLPWTDHLFFSTPLLVATRLSQAKQGGWLEMVRANAYFIRAAFSDGTPNHVLHGYKTLLRFTLPLILAGPLAAAYQLFRQKLQRRLNAADSVLSVFFIWEAASLTFIFLFNLNVNRFNHFYLPCLALCAWVVHFGARAIIPSAWKPAAYSVATAILLWQGSSAVQYYFTEYPHGKIRDRFNVGLEEAFASAEKLTDVGQVLITKQMPLPDAYALFFLKYPPDKFRREVQVEISNGEYKINRFGKYVFYLDYLTPSTDYGYVSRLNELHDSDKQHREIRYTNERWEVGVMRLHAR